MTFLEHTYRRRQRLSTLWTADELVWGEIGPKLTTRGHNYGSHFTQLYASYPNALPEATRIIEKHLVCILNRPYRDFEELYDFIEQLLANPSIPTFKVEGIGWVALYDIALRIGCNLRPRVIPKDQVYLGAKKVREAANTLVPGIVSGDMFRVPITDLAAFFPHFTSMEIEDILCIYSDKIKAAGKFELKWLNNCPCVQCK